MFYLIGVNHDVQRHKSGAMLDNNQAELRQCLEKAISSYHPKVIAVEESEDTLVDRKAGIPYESIPRNVALRHGVEPIFCEPLDTDKERIGYWNKLQIHLELFKSDLLRNCPLGMEDAAAHAVEMALIFPVREEFWIDKLKMHLESEVVLVLGEDHIESFIGRLELRRIPYKVLARGIGVTPAQMRELVTAKKFAYENQELFGAMLKHMKQELRLQEDGSKGLSS
jgi:hypothetical protein